MIEYGLIAGAASGAQGLLAAALDGARRGAEAILSLAADNPVVSLAVLAGALAWTLLRRR